LAREPIIMFARRLTIAATSLLLPSVGCDDPDAYDLASPDDDEHLVAGLLPEDVDDERADVPTPPAEAYVSLNKIWATHTARVCWINPAAWNNTHREWVRDAVTRSWSHHADITFTGWGTCTAQDNEIRIYIDESNPRSYVGTDSKLVNPSMYLNFTFNSWSPSCKTTLEHCIRTIGVHEFGHAIGFDHEQNRPDTPSWCQKDAQSSGTTVIGPWDENSVMNYCNDTWNNGGVLSPGDITAVQQVYGPRIAWFHQGGGLASGPAVSSWAAGRLDTFVRGTDNALHHKWWQGSWSGWESLGGVITSDPAAVSWGPGRIDVFARGTDNALHHKWYGGDVGWSAWESLGGSLTSGPAVASWAPGRLDVFARGPDNTLHHKWFDGGWSAWENLGGSITSDPAAVSWGPGRIDVFARGTDNALHHKAYAGGWHGWANLGGGLTSAPGVSSWGSGRLDVFVRGTDNALHHKWYDGGWSGWESLLGTLTSAPDAVSWGPGRIDVFVRGSDNAMWQTRFDSGWN
jgi:hypothetical protein